MLRNENHYGKCYSHMRTGKCAGRFFAGGLQETHELTEEVAIGDFVERRREIELRSHHRQDGEYNIIDVERTDKYKNNLVYQFFTKKIAPDCCSENDEEVGKIAKIHQFAEPSPRHLFTELEARLTTEQRQVGSHKMMV